MAATVTIRELNAADNNPGTSKSGGTIRFKNADNATADLSNPMVKPGAGGHDYSYEKYLRLRIDGGTFTQVSGVKTYSDGGNGWTGVALKYKTNASYSAPVETDATWHTGATDFFTKTSGSALTLGAGPYDNTGVPKFVGDCLILGIDVTDTVSAGVLTGETLTFAWDEI